MSVQRVSIVDHGTGNLFSVARALEHLGAQPELVSTPEDIVRADRLILPGVGAFGDCAAAVRRLGLAEPILDHAERRPLLGICLGMQLLFDGSDEMGEHVGLGIIPGHVRRLPTTDADGRSVKIPHIGWDTLLMPASRATWQGSVLERLEEGEPVYFVHSYAPEPSRPEDSLAEVSFAAQRVAVAVQRGGVAGCQFHPERSGPAGLDILQAFLTL